MDVPSRRVRRRNQTRISTKFVWATESLELIDLGGDHGCKNGTNSGEAT